MAVLDMEGSAFPNPRPRASFRHGGGSRHYTQLNAADLTPHLCSLSPFPGGAPLPGGALLPWAGAAGAGPCATCGGGGGGAGAGRGIRGGATVGGGGAAGPTT